jgi:small subunit ribosomal protein S19e
MTSVKDADTGKLIGMTAEELKKLDVIRPPEWASFAKTGTHKERPPEQKDWWYIRTASILRKIYIENAGVEKLRKVYGGRKNLGHQPEHKRKASGAIIRKSLQQLEAAGLVEKDARKGGKTKGRKISSKGQSLLNSVAKKMK